MTTQTIDETVLAAYLKGELDPEGSEAVERWYDASAENQRLLGQVYHILYINDRINASAGFDPEYSLGRVKDRMRSRRRKGILLRAVRWTTTAAAAVVLLFAGTVFTQRLDEHMSRPLTVQTQLGERSQVILPDGSKVWLNSCSSVKYSSSFFSRERRVEMTGEAYFIVEKDPHAPFIVSSDGLDIEVLGTRFNVRSDNDLHRITTVLLEGSIEARGGSSTARLRPSQQIIFNTDTREMLVSECCSVERSISWIDGKFRFDRNTFSEIVAELQRYYNVNIQFADARLRDERFSGDFRVEDGIYHILSILQLTNKFHYEIDHNEIRLYQN